MVLRVGKCSLHCENLKPFIIIATFKPDTFQISNQRKKTKYFRLHENQWAH